MLLVVVAPLLLASPAQSTLNTQFWLFTRENVDTPELMEFDGETAAVGPSWDPARPTKLVAHGWGGKTHIDLIFAAAYARAGLDYNVIGVDWRGMEGPAREQVVEVGKYAARFLVSLADSHGLQLHSAHPIGFSYGAHVVGG